MDELEKGFEEKLTKKHREIEQLEMKLSEACQKVEDFRQFELNNKQVMAAVDDLKEEQH